MKIRKTSLFLALVLLIGVLYGSVMSVSALSVSRYAKNAQGLTYGNVDPRLPPTQQEFPQLIAAIGIGGTEGYVYASDLDGDQPKNPEEALKYMAELEKEIERAKSMRSVYLRTIPLYASDGVTVIGEFGISYPE